MKGELSGKIIKEVAALRSKMYSYMTNDGYVDKKAKETKKCEIKHKIKFESYKNCSKNNEKMLKADSCLPKKLFVFALVRAL